MNYPKTFDEYIAQKNRQAAGNTPAASGGFSYPATFDEYMQQKGQNQLNTVQTAEREKCLSASGFDRMQTDMGTLFGGMDGYFQSKHRIGATGSGWKERVGAMLQSVEKERDYFNRYAGVMGEDAQKYQNRLNEWETQLKRYQSALSGNETDEDSLALGSGLARFRTEANDYFTKASETEAGTAVANKAMQWASGAKKLLKDANEVESYLKKKNTAEAQGLLQQVQRYKTQLAQMQETGTGAQTMNPLTGKPMGAAINPNLPRYTDSTGEKITAGSPYRLGQAQEAAQNAELSGLMGRKAEKADWQNQTVQQHEEYIRKDFDALKKFTQNGTSQGAAENIHAGIFQEIAARLNYLLASGKCTEEEYAQLLEKVDGWKREYLEEANHAYKNYPNKWTGDAQGAIRRAAEAIPDKGDAMKEFRYQNSNLTRENIRYKTVDELLARMHFTYGEGDWGNSAAERAAITFMGQEVLPEYLANTEMTQEQYDRFMQQIKGTPNETQLRKEREANGLKANPDGQQAALDRYKEIDGQTYLDMFETGSQNAADNIMLKYPGGMEQVLTRGLGYITKATGKVLNMFGENPVGNYFVEGGQQGIDYENKDWQAGKQREYEQGRYASDLLQNGSKFEKFTAGMTKDLTQAALEMAAAGAIAGQISAGNTALAQLSQGGKYASSLANAQKGATGYMKFASQMAGLMKNSSNLIISANAALNSYGEAEDSGMSAAGRAVKLLAGGLIEYGTNGLFGGNPIVDPENAGLISKYITDMTDNETIRKIVSSKVFDRIGEGLEEVASAVAGAALDYALTGETDLTAKELVDEFTVGVLLSMVMSAPEDIIDLTARAKSYVKSRVITRFDANAQTNLESLYRAMTRYELEYLAGDENLMRMNGWSEKEIKRARSDWETVVREFNTLADRLEGTQSLSDSFRRYEAPEGFFDNDFVDADFQNAILANQTSEAALLTDRALDIRILSEREMIDSLRGSEAAQDIYTARDAQQRLDILEQEKAARAAERAQRAAERAGQENTPAAEQTVQEAPQTAQEEARNDMEEENTPAEPVQAEEVTAPTAQANEGGTVNESNGQGEERTARVDSTGEAVTVERKPERANDAGAGEGRTGNLSEAARRGKLEERVKRFSDVAQDKPVSELMSSGDPDALVGVIPVRKYTKEMQQMQRAAKSHGMKLTYVKGTLSIQAKSGEYINANGAYDKETGRIFASVSSAEYEPEQIAQHELYHALIAKGEANVELTLQLLRNEFSDEQLMEIAREYEKLYFGVYDSGADVWEEIFADAYSGMNRFGTGKIYQLQRTVAESTPEVDVSEPAAEISDATRRTQDSDGNEKAARRGGTRASMAGPKAKTASSKSLALAEAMEEDGASREEIWRKTGWIRGADGQWRFEVDDSKAEFRPNGDASLLGEPRYRRLEELTDKWGDSFEKGGEPLTEAEEAEMEALQEEYSDRVWEKKYELQDFLKHDELYEAYPLLRHTTLRFEKLDPGVKGKFDKRNGSIILSDSLFGKGPETLLHEIQHIIQKYEGFQGGTSPEYWARRDYESGDRLQERLQREYDDILNGLTKEEQNDYIRYQEIDGELERLFYSEKPGDTEKYDRMDAEHDRLYEKLYPKEWFGKLLDLKRQMENPGEVYLGQYINSAGEIEARETASRRKLTAEERKNKMPDLGWDRALLTEDGEGTSKVQLSVDNPEGFAEAITQWDADGRRKTDFILGSTGEVLQGLGAIESDVYMRSEKIETILKQHPEMSLEEIKKIPSVLNDPVLVLKSRQSDSKRGNSRVVVFGSMKNTNGAPMLAVLDLRPVEGNLLIEDMQKVVSAYVKTGNPAGFLKNSEAMFVDKKRAARLLRSTGLQLRPGSLPPSGYIGSITYRGKNVNITGKQFSEFLQETKETGNENLTTIRNLNEDDLEALGEERNPEGYYAQRVKFSLGQQTESKRLLTDEEKADKGIRVYGRGEGQVYKAVPGDTVELISQGYWERNPDGTWEEGKYYNLGSIEVPKNGDENTLVVTGLPNRAKFESDETPNYILSGGRMALNRSSANNNTSEKIKGAVESEIYSMVGLRKDGYFYRIIKSEKEIDYIKGGKIRRSVNHATGEKEDGYSVWEYPKYPGDLVEVTGEAISIGSDGEPVLDVHTVKFVRVIEDWMEQYQKGKELFKEKYGWSDAQLEQALRGGYQLNRELPQAASSTPQKFSLTPTEKAQRAQERAETAEAKAEEAKQTAQESYKRELTGGLKKLFEVQSYDNEALGKLLESPMAEMQQGVKLLKAEKDDLFEALMNLGTATLPADDYYREIREALRGRRIFVPEGIREDFGDDWEDFRKKAFSSGIYFTDKASDRSVDVHMLELADAYPSEFTEEYIASEMLRQIVDAAEKGKDARMSLRKGMEENEKRFGLKREEQLEYQRQEFEKLLNRYEKQAGAEAREAQARTETDERLESLIREADGERPAKKPEGITEPWTISEAAAQKRGFPFLNGRQVYPLRTWVKAADMGNYGLVLDKSTKKGMLTVLFTNKETGLSSVKDMETKLLTAVEPKYQPSVQETAALLASMPQEKLEDAADAEDLAEFYNWYDAQTAEEDARQKAETRAAAEEERKGSIVRTAEEYEKKKQERLEDVQKAYLERYGTSEPNFPYGKGKPMYSRGTSLQPGEALALLQAMTGKKWELTNRANGTWKATITKEDAPKSSISPKAALEKLQASKKTFADLTAAGIHPEGTPKESFKGSPALEKAGIKIDGGIAEYSQVDAMRKGAETRRSIQRQIEKTAKKWDATKRELREAKKIASGRSEYYRLPDKCRPEVVSQLAALYLNERMTGEDLIQIRKGEIRDGLLYKMIDLFPTEKEIQADPSLFKPEKLLVLNYRTALRSMVNIFGEERGMEIYNYLFAPVVRNTAESYRWMNGQFDDVRKFTDSKGEKSELNQTESAYVHMMLDVEGYVQQAQESDRSKDLISAAENVARGESVENEAIEFALNSEEAKIVEKYAQWINGKDAEGIDKVKCENAMKEYRGKFDLYFEAINDFLVAHGMQPIGKIKGYTPHIPIAERFNSVQKALDDLWKALGIKDETVTRLPAEIAGRTETFRPQKRWNPFFLERKGDKTAYDIEEAFQNYVQYLGDILFHTDDIQKIRAAESYLRKGLRGSFTATLEKALDMSRSGNVEEKVEYLQEMGRIGNDMREYSNAELAEAFDKLIEEMLGEAQNNTRYSDLVVWLKNYGDILAGKQFGGDRGTEYMGGREWLNIGNKLVGAFAKANVAGNLSSVLNQSAQLAMLQATRSQRAILKATQEFCTGKLGEFRKEIDFLTGKMGIDYLVQSGTDKFVSGMFAPAEFMDSMLSTIATRAAYWDAIRNGKNHEEAMRFADWYGRALMADRTKGAKPLAFHSKGMWKRMANLFQIEPLNTVEFVMKDMPLEIQREAEKNGKKSAARMLLRTIFGYLIAAFVLNRLTDELYGGTPAPLDIAGLTANFFASGKGLSTNDYMKSLINKVVGSEIFDVPEERETFDTSAALADSGYNLMNEIPFASNLSGLFGVGDRTMPMPDIFGSGKNIADAIKTDGFFSGASAEAVAKLLAQLVPGGRQLSKTGFGVKALIEGGKTKGYGEKQRLQYPLDMDDPMTYIRTALFGVNASPEAKAYYAGDDSGLTAKQTQIWNELREEGVNGYALYGLMMRMDDAMNYSDIPEPKDDESEEEKEKRLQMKEEHRKKARAELAAQENLTDGQRMRIYSAMVESGKNDAIDKLMDAGMKWKDISEILDKRGELGAGRSEKEWAADFANWLDGKKYSGKQREAIDEELVPKSAKFYGEMTAAGVSAGSALKIEKKARDLAGENDLNQTFKAQAVMQSGLSDKEAYAALGAVYTGSTAEKFRAAQTEGIPAKVYAEFWTREKELHADKDEDGKSISGSRKEKVIELIDGLSLTAEQKDWIMGQEYENVKWWQMPWN